MLSHSTTPPHSSEAIPAQVMTMMMISEVKHSMQEMRAELHLSKIFSLEQMQLQTTSAAT